MLHKRAMLARVTVRRWNVNMHDRKVSQEVDVAHGATDGGRYSKRLIDKAHVKALMASASAIRNFHYKNTLPWDDEGDRLLPAKSLQKYTDGLRILKDQDEVLRNDFIRLYPSLVSAAPARLGTMFDPNDFPDVSDLPSKFDIVVKLNQIPDVADFRVDVSKDAANDIRAQIVADQAERFQSAMKDCYQRMHKVVSHLSTTLKGEDPRIFDTLVTNANDLVECLGDLNLADDPVLEKLRQNLHEILPSSARAFKHNPELRAEVAEQADELLAKMVGYV